MTSISELITKLQAAPGPDRELDLDITVSLDPAGKIAEITRFRRGFDGKEGMAWDLHLESICFEKRTADGRCPFNGGYPLPRYTASIDAALTLVPVGYVWDCGHSKHVPHYAVVASSKMAHGGWSGECNSNRAIAICIAALKAREAAR